jgi:hypothetical protein
LSDGARSNADDAALRTVLALVAEFNRRGEYVSTASNSPACAWRLLSREPAFPAGVDRNRLDGLTRDAERRGLLVRLEYQNENRKTKSRWELTPAALELSADGEPGGNPWD